MVIVPVCVERLRHHLLSTPTGTNGGNRDGAALGLFHLLHGGHELCLQRPEPAVKQAIQKEVPNLQQAQRTKAFIVETDRIRNLFPPTLCLHEGVLR